VFRDGEVHDLNALIPPDTGWTLTWAHDLNDAGQILAQGSRPDGTRHTFLVTPIGLPTPAAPVPEPTTLALLGLVSAATGVRLGSRRPGTRAGRPAGPSRVGARPDGPIRRIP
jgi:hypothetical protein